METLTNAIAKRSAATITISCDGEKPGERRKVPNISTIGQFSHPDGPVATTTDGKTYHLK
jgi:hypothetical protein